MKEQGTTPVTPGHPPMDAHIKYTPGFGPVQDAQNLPMALLMGLVAAIAGALVWATVTALTNFQIGWMAIGVGFLVGLAVRRFGNGKEISFRASGAFLALFGCLLGNVLTVCYFAAQQAGAPILEVVGRLNLTMAADAIRGTFSPMDLLFYGLAVYAGYKYSVAENLRPSATTPGKI